MSAAAGGAAPPEWLSTHPSNERRIAALEARVPEALLVHERARAAGRRPDCS
jgi:predicted Zn-dependent protease